MRIVSGKRIIGNKSKFIFSNFFQNLVVYWKNIL